MEYPTTMKFSAKCCFEEAKYYGRISELFENAYKLLKTPKKKLNKLVSTLDETERKTLNEILVDLTEDWDDYTKSDTGDKDMLSYVWKQRVGIRIFLKMLEHLDDNSNS